MSKVGWGACPVELGALILEVEDIKRLGGEYEVDECEDGVCSRCLESKLRRGDALEEARAAAFPAGKHDAPKIRTAGDARVTIS